MCCLWNFRLFSFEVCISKSNCLDICYRSRCSSTECVAWEMNFFVVGLESLILVKSCVVALYTNSLEFLCITNPQAQGNESLRWVEAAAENYDQLRHLIRPRRFHWIWSTWASAPPDPFLTWSEDVNRPRMLKDTQKWQQQWGDAGSAAAGACSPETTVVPVPPGRLGSPAESQWKNWGSTLHQTKQKFTFQFYIQVPFYRLFLKLPINFSWFLMNNLYRIFCQWKNKK